MLRVLYLVVFNQAYENVLIATFNQIQRFSQEVVDKFQPEKIVLFGSYAYGEPSQDSDVDLLVVLPFEGHSALKATEIRLAVDRDFPLDLIVRTSQHIQQRLELGDFFIQEILHKSRILYEADYARVDR